MKKNIITALTQCCKKTYAYTYIHTYRGGGANYLVVAPLLFEGGSL